MWCASKKNFTGCDLDKGRKRLERFSEKILPLLCWYGRKYATDIKQLLPNFLSILIHHPSKCLELACKRNPFRNMLEGAMLKQGISSSHLQGRRNHERGPEDIVVLLARKSFLGTRVAQKVRVRCSRSVSVGIGVRASERGSPKPPVFVLNVKPERKALLQEEKLPVSLENYDFGDFKVDPNHRSGNF